FAATSSQGLLYGFELLYTIAGWRVPLVVVNVSRALASPIKLAADQHDILARRVHAGAGYTARGGAGGGILAHVPSQPRLYPGRQTHGPRRGRLRWRGL